jgi:DNA-binding MarR family transcriptional regulator
MQWTSGYDRPMPFEDSAPSFVDGYLAALLAMSSALISSEFHHIVKDHGFSVTEWRILATLTDSDGVSVGRLADIALSKQPTVTRLVDRMSARGLVCKATHPNDRRKTVIRITPQGRDIIASLIAQAKAHEHRVLEPFGHARAEELKTILREIIKLHQSI